MALGLSTELLNCLVDKGVMYQKCNITPLSTKITGSMCDMAPLSSKNFFKILQI